ncbi:MAG: hypothetical protein O3B87_04680, partial [bacterium]|nr:hypothetical protein [bacterium]
MGSEHYPQSPYFDASQSGFSFYQKLPIKFIAIGVSLLLIGITGGWYLGSMNTKDSTEMFSKKEQAEEIMEKEIEDVSGWKTFVSKFNNISFKYPPEYEKEDRSNYISIISPIDKTTGKVSRPINLDELKMEIVVFDSIQNDSLSKWREELQQETSGTISDLGVTTIDDIETQVLLGEGVGTAKIYLMIHNGKRYMIIKYPFTTSRDWVFDQILSTFELIEEDAQTTNINKNNLQIYNNSEYKFSFSYPEEIQLTEQKTVINGVPYEIYIGEAIKITVR